MGFDAKWGVLGAADVGANHQRDRIWIVGKQMAYSKELFSNGSNNNSRISMEQKTQSKFRNNCGSKDVAHTSEIRPFSQEAKQGIKGKFRFIECGVDRKWWEREPDNASRTIERNMGGVVDGVASRVDRLKAIGNGQVPLCAATAWRILSENTSN
jgi:DNA (cytosine-5)-methyltransferase 1